MKRVNDYKMGKHAYLGIICSSLIGIRTILLPRDASVGGRPDGWIAIILTGILAIAIINVQMYVMRKHQVKDFYDYVHEGFGSILSKLLFFVFTIYFVLVSSFEISSMKNMVRFFLLPNTPMEIVVFSFLMVGVYALSGGVGVVGKLCSLFTILTFAVTAVIYFFGLSYVEFVNLKPVLGDGILPIVKQLPLINTLYLGIETSLLYSKDLKEDVKVNKYISIGIAVIILINTLTYLIVVGILSIDVHNIVWPTISAIQSFEVYGIFIERLESFFLIAWILQFFTTFLTYFYLSVQTLTKVFNNSVNTNIIVIVPIIFLIANFSQSVNASTNMFKVMTNGFTMWLIIPFVTACLVALKRKHKRKKQKI